MTTIRSRVSRCVALSVLATAVCLGSPAAAQDPAALEKVTSLNKKAVAAYENLEFDEAIRLLQNALQLCAAEGMNKHAAKARTHIHLGMVMVGGLKQTDRGIAQFKRALEIDPAIKLTKSLVNPDIQAAFDEAVRTIAEPDRTAEDKAPEAASPVAGGDAGRAPRNVTGVVHTPVTEAAPASTIEIRAAVDEKLAPDKVILAYRAEGASDFLARDMEQDEAGWYVARIPDPATQGSVVSYYIEARNKAGQPLAANGSLTEPHVISLAAPQPADQVADGESPDGDVDVEEEADEADRGGAPRYFLALGIGAGYGYASGTPEVSPTDGEDTLNFSGFAPAQLMHISPEFGYYYSSRLLLSLQGRIQLVTGATEVRDESCPEKGVCAPAKGALAALGKATWFFGEPGAFRPFASMSAGFGEIRHLVSLPLKDCGPDPMNGVVCQDTILGGSVLLGPGAGFTYALSDAFSFIGSVNALAGFPNTTLNFDLNVGVALGI